MRNGNQALAFPGQAKQEASECSSPQPGWRARFISPPWARSQTASPAMPSRGNGCWVGRPEANRVIRGPEVTVVNAGAAVTCAACPHPPVRPRSRRPRGARKPRQAYHHGDLRNAAVAEAVSLIGQTRDTAFTLRDLAARLRVTSTALYRHFPGKLALLAAVAEEGFRALVEACARHEALLESDPVAGFREQGLEYVRFALRNPGHFRVMFSPDLARAKDEYPSLREAAQASYQQLKRMLTACQAQGLLSEFELDTIALTVWSTVHGIATLLLRWPGEAGRRGQRERGAAAGHGRAGAPRHARWRPAAAEGRPAGCFLRAEALPISSITRYGARFVRPATVSQGGSACLVYSSSLSWRCSRPAVPAGTIRPRPTRVNPSPRSSATCRVPRLRRPRSRRAS